MDASSRGTRCNDESSGRTPLRSAGCHAVSESPVAPGRGASGGWGVPCEAHSESCATVSRRRNQGHRCPRSSGVAVSATNGRASTGIASRPAQSSMNRDGRVRGRGATSDNAGSVTVRRFLGPAADESRQRHAHHSALREQPRPVQRRRAHAGGERPVQRWPRNAPSRIRHPEPLHRDQGAAPPPLLMYSLALRTRVRAHVVVARGHPHRRQRMVAPDGEETVAPLKSLVAANATSPSVSCDRKWAAVTATPRAPR